MPQKNVVDGLFADTADGPRLLGSRCATCEQAAFPRTASCHNPGCDDSKMEDAEFGPRGMLWTVAIQNYPPPPPVLYNEPFEPFAVGLVDLPEGLRVLGRLDTDDPQGIELDSEVELVIGELKRDEDGTSIVSWLFKPVAA